MLIQRGQTYNEVYQSFKWDIPEIYNVGTEIFEWAQRELCIRINEVYGQTECNLILANNGSIMPIKPGSMGRPTPAQLLPSSMNRAR